MASNSPSSVRAVTWLLLRRPDELATEDLDLVTALSRKCLEIGVAYGLVQDFASLIRERERWQLDRGALASWVRVATALGRFLAQLPDA